MKKTKKFLALVLALLLVCSAFSGCSKKEETKPAESTTPPATETTTPTEPEFTPVEFTDPINIIVPFAAGGGMDLLARAAQPFLQEVGIESYVTNIAGGNSAIGSMEAYHADPDGYTILCSGIETIMGYNMGGVLESAVEEYVQLGCLVYDPHIICVPKDSPFNTVDDLIAYAKEHPGELDWAGTGSKGNNEMASAELWEAAGISVNFVPYDSGSKTRTACMGGHVDVMHVQLSEAKSVIDSGDVKPLAVYTADRSALYPDIPTLKESGYDIDNGLHRGFFAPPGTPEDVQKTLADAFKVVYENPGFQKAVAEQCGFGAFYISPEDCMDVIDTRYPIQTALLEKMNAVG